MAGSTRNGIPRIASSAPSCWSENAILSVGVLVCFGYDQDRQILGCGLAERRLFVLRRPFGGFDTVFRVRTALGSERGHALIDRYSAV